MKLTFSLVLLTSLLLFSSCQSNRLLSKKANQVIEERMTTVFEKYAKGAILGRASSIEKDAGLDSLQAEKLAEVSQWNYLLQPRLKAILDFATSKKRLSKEERALLCDCIQNESSTVVCEKLIQPIAEETAEQVGSLLQPLEYAMTDRVLKENWVKNNASKENCATLHAGLFYYLTPYQKARVEVDRYEGGQTETLGSSVSRYKVTWSSYNSYRLIEIDAEKEFDVQFEVLQVQPTHYIFKCLMPSKTGAVDYIIGRLYRAEKKS